MAQQIVDRYAADQAVVVDHTHSRRSSADHD
jgi:hypothetical protein